MAETDGLVVEDARCYPGAEADPLAYPGRRPATSYVFSRGKVYPVGSSGQVWTGQELQAIDAFCAGRAQAPLAERIAVLAIGSNSAPGRLLEKFPDNETIPVVTAQCSGLSAVYMPWAASYGAVPATVDRTPQGALSVWVTFLSADQFATMNHTERVGSIYHLVALPKGSIRCLGQRLSSASYAYCASSTLRLNGKRAHIRSFEAEIPEAEPKMTQREVLTAVLDQLGMLVGQTVEQRHQKIRSNNTLRAGFVAALAEKLSGPSRVPSSWRMDPHDVEESGISPR